MKLSPTFPVQPHRFLRRGAVLAAASAALAFPAVSSAATGCRLDALAQTDPLTREFERRIAGLNAVNPYTGMTDSLMVAMADQTAMKALHMFTTGDPARNASFVLFADANYFITDFPTTTCKTCINPAFAWNHGDIQPEIARTWAGFVGPGVRKSTVVDAWTDHADVRPTMLKLLGLRDAYRHDGRTIYELMQDRSTARDLRGDRAMVALLGQVYKQVNAPFGVFAMSMLAASTRTLKSGSAADDSVYLAIQNEIAELTAYRDAVAESMKMLLDGVVFEGAAGGRDRRLFETRARRLILDAEGLLFRAELLAAG